MKFRLSPLFMAFLLPVAHLGQSVAATRDEPANPSRFVGVWRGRFDNLPGVDLVITEESGQLYGAVLFHLHIRPDAHSPYTSTPGLPEPMFDLNLEGQTLKFEVSHRRAHPPRSLHDPPVVFVLSLAGPDKADLVNESEGDGPSVVLSRSDY